MTFNELDNLISQIYRNVYEDDLGMADDLIAMLSDALYDGKPGRLLSILEEWDAKEWIRGRFFVQLEEAIYEYLNEQGGYPE